MIERHLKVIQKKYIHTVCIPSKIKTKRNAVKNNNIL